MKVISVDPGKAGAVIFWISNRPQSVLDMPLMTAGSKTIVDYAILGTAFNKFKPDVVVIEQVGASPRMGTSSAFNFGMGFGILLGVSAGCGALVETMRPQKWKAAHGLINTDKSQALKRAIECYPDIAHWFKRKKDVDRADCLLIGDTYLMFNG